VILLDANLLVYAHLEEAPQHEAARTWLDGRLSERVKVGLPWSSLLGFVRLVTNPRVVDRPLPIGDAWTQVEDWLKARPTWIPNPTERHGEVLASLIPSVSRSDLVSDAHLAALAIEHGLLLTTTDRDFARFPGLRWENPLGPN
jgi:uncharacterized protein